MKNPIVGRGISSALFVLTTREDGEYDLLRGTNGSGRLMQAIVEVISEKMLTTSWIYIDYLIRADYVRPGVCKARNLFEVPIKQAPISGFTDQIRFNPETFFKENEPGLVVAPFAAINLGSFIEVVIVVRDRETPVYSDDVTRSLKSFVEAEKGETPTLLPEMFRRMASRIGAALDSDSIEVGGKKLYLSIGARIRESPAVTPKPERRPFTIRREVVSPVKVPITQSFWPPPADE